MDVDNLIERHRMRLVEHKRFLNAEGGSPRSDSALAEAARKTESSRGASSTSRTSREAAITSTLARAMDAAEHHNGLPASMDAVIRMDDVNANRGGMEALPANSTAAMFFGFAGEEEQEVVEDRLLAQHLQATGKYFVKGPPDSMYQRSVWWLSNREKQLKDQENNIKAAELAECTFRPVTETSAKRVSRSGTPNRKGGRIHGRSVSPGDAAALSHHLLRQEHARNLKKEAQRRVEGPDISKWTPRQTVPREFDLGKRNVPIASLRQPVWNQQQRHQVMGDDVEQGSGGMRQPQFTSNRHNASPSAEGGRGTQDEVRNYRGSSNSNEDDRRDALVDALQRKVSQLEVDNETLRRQVTEQQTTIQSRTRELEIAKNTVRKLTVQGASM